MSESTSNLPSQAPQPMETMLPPQQEGGPQERLREDLIQPDPLLDCLVNVCKLQGQGASRATLSAGLPLVDGKMSLSLVERAVQRTGMTAKIQRLGIEKIKKATLPVILILKNNQACVFLGWEAVEGKGNYAKVLMPETGLGAVLRNKDELISEYTGIAIFVKPRFMFDQRTSNVEDKREGHWFWGAIQRQRLIYKDVLWAAFLINVFALVMPIFTMNVYDRVVPNHAFETLWALAIGVVLVLGADLMMRKLRSHFIDQASARVDVDISASLMEKVLGIKLSHRPQSVGSFASNLRGFEQVRDFIAASTVTTLVDLPFALLFLAVIIWISPWLAIPVVAVFLAIVIVGYILQHRMHEYAQTTYKASAQRNAVLVEALSAIETVKAQAAEGSIQSRWEQANLFLARQTVKMRGLSSSAQYATNWLQQIVTVCLVTIGVYLISDRQLTMGALIAVNMLSSRALAPTAQIVSLLMQYQGVRTALNSLNQIMSTPVERPQGTSFVHRRELKGQIEFRNVEFSYPGRQDAALNGVSFKINPGDRVALIGKVGSGKTTLQKLILGLYEPTAGEILLDGIDIRQLDPADVRRNIGYVSQEVTLLYGTLRENIALGMPHADDSAIVHAAEIAGLNEFINRHPLGFDMPVGERGDSLSGGQRQSVGIARAVLHNAPILILDEPTSAMDFSTEAEVTKKINGVVVNKTVVLVTHRTSMLSMVNRVIVVDNGKIVADGPRDRIMEALQSGRISRAA